MFCSIIEWKVLMYTLSLFKFFLALTNISTFKLYADASLKAGKSCLLKKQINGHVKL